MFFGFYKERKKMSKVYNYYKDKIEQDAVIIDHWEDELCSTCYNKRKKKERKND